ncbi:MAG: LptF/LptG family permease [Verrucomicrobiota bacterium]|nr:LptF/LptG family permease [Verrucomicrobiota bacterium]
MKLWQRHLFYRLTLTFSFLLCSLFAIYLLLDLSINGVRFLGKGHAEPLSLLFYYLRSFSVHLELFLPLSFLLTVLKVLLDLNEHLELVALQMAGLSRKKLLVPFFFFASFLSLTCYANSEWIAPTAINAAKTFRATYSTHNKKPRRENLHALVLQDGSELVYQTFSDHELFDVFWIRSRHDIWMMKTLTLTTPPTGYFVDHLVRTHQLEKTESYPIRSFPELTCPSPKPFIPFESRPLSTLLQEALYASSDKASVQTHLHYKLALPLLSFLILLALAPFTLRFSRTRPLFLLAALSLFAFFAILTLLDSCLILGENQVFSPALAIWSPLSLLFALSVPRFSRL